MLITEQELFKLAELAKLDIDIDGTNYNKVIQNLNNILELVEQLNNVDTNGIEPMFQADDLAKQRLRLDVVIENNTRDDLQNIAPANRIESGLYLVPKVIDP